jgi:general stress protein YciG
MNANRLVDRPAPAFQEYASDMLANAYYRTMSLAERGLLDTMRRECWVNGSIPKNPNDLADLLGKPAGEINLNLSIKVLHFFREHNDKLICPELDSYRANLAEKKQRMSEGGSKGGKATQQKNKVAKATLKAMLKPLSGGELSRDELSRAEKQSLGKSITAEEINQFVSELEDVSDATNNYLQASKGGH